MKRFLKIAAAFMFMAVLCVGPAQAGYDHYTINVYRDVGYRTGSFGHEQVTSGCQYAILYNGSLNYCSMTTVYSDKGMTSIQNPVDNETFDAAGKIDFYIDSADGSTVDIILVDNSGGFTLYMNDVPPSCHTAIINERAGEMHQGTAWYTLSPESSWSTASSAAANMHTDITLHALTMIHDVYVEPIVVSTLSQSEGASAGQINIGYGSVYDAFMLEEIVDTKARATKDAIMLTTASSGGIFDGAVWTYNCIEATPGDINIRPFLIRENVSLNWTRDSGSDSVPEAQTMALAGTNGWGFIHYWFTSIRPQHGTTSD